MEVQQYLRETKKRELASRRRLDMTSQATRQEIARLMALRRDMATCLLEIGASAERDRQALLAAAAQSEGRKPVDGEADLQPLSPTGEVDQAKPGELLHAAQREVERLIRLRRAIANDLLEIATSAERHGQALRAAYGQAGNDHEQIDGEKADRSQDWGVSDPQATSRRLWSVDEPLQSVQWRRGPAWCLACLSLMWLQFAKVCKRSRDRGAKAAVTGHDA